MSGLDISIINDLAPISKKNYKEHGLFVKGIIHFYEEDKIEVLYEEFFNPYINWDSLHMNASDWEAYLEDMALEYAPEDMKKEVDLIYSVLIHFKIQFYKDYWGESDADTIILDYQFHDITKEHNNLYPPEENNTQK